MKIIKVFRNIILGSVVIIITILTLFTFTMTPLPFLEDGYIISAVTKNDFKSSTEIYWSFVVREGLSRLFSVMVVVIGVMLVYHLGDKINKVCFYNHAAGNGRSKAKVKKIK